MVEETSKTPLLDDERAMLIDQSLKYAQDMVRVYEEEKAKRKEIESVNEMLREEIERRGKTEEALRVSEERFRTIFESARDCIYIKDRSLRYTQVNPAMENLLLLPGNEILGKKDSDIFDLKAASHLREVDRRVLEGESVEEEYTRLINNSPVTLLEAKAPLTDDSGRIVGICGIARNITERRYRGSVAPFTGLGYPSKAMRGALAHARRVASQGSLVLLLGESGAGKDFMARYIHDHSDRANGPFFAINCASVARELAESELFGHEPGAFTGAGSRKRGLLELAEGGTLFLNEIGELSPHLQAKLLSFLDTRTFTRVGGERSVSVNARLIAATNRDLEKEATEGRFRHDLFYRLNVLSIRIPSLRERQEDIPLLVQQITSQLTSEIRLESPPEFSREAIDALKAYDWPGNVRELRNLLERTLILTGGGRIDRPSLALTAQNDEWVFSARFPETGAFNEMVRNLKRGAITEALRRSGGNRVQAARLLGISRNSLNHYLESLWDKNDKDTEI